MAFKPTFPLPKGYFGPTRLSVDQQRRFRDIVRRRLDSALRDEHEYVRVNRRKLNPNQWKLVKKKHQLHIYSRRRAPTSLAAADEDTGWRPTMMSVGRMEGSLEDMIYGSYDKSHEEMKTTLSYADVTARDSTVLHNIELATPEDPFHYVGIKWLLTKLPGSLVIRMRDWCYVEAMGIKLDADGRRFGYIILHSVDVASCPPFDARTVVRGRTQLSFIFRETVPGVVEVFAQSLFDPAGDLVQYYTTVMTTEVLAGVFMMTKCAEAKKLTLLALRNVRDTRLKIMSKLERLPESCAVCSGQARVFSSLKPCRICDVIVCSQCRVKKKIFVGPRRIVCKVACCRRCILQAQNMEVRPAEPTFSILGEMVLPPERFETTVSSEGSSTPPHRRHQDSTTSDEQSHSSVAYSYSDTDVDGDGLSELGESGYRFSIEGGLSEEGVEKLIAAKLNQRAYSSNNNRSLTIPETSSLTIGDSSSRNRSIDDSLAAPAAPAAPAVTSLVAHRETPAAPELPTAGSERDRARLEQTAMYEKILRLQSVADEVYTITQANNAMMLKSFT